MGACEASSVEQGKKLERGILRLGYVEIMKDLPMEVKFWVEDTKSER